jgi:hypothetical protein
VRVLEGFGNVVGADDLVPERRSQGAVFVEGFVDDVPTLDAALITANDGMDVVAHAGEQRVPGEEVSLVVMEDPGRGLAVPNEIVTDDEHVVLLAEGDVLVGEVEVVLVRLRVNVLPLEAVLGRDGVELGGDDGAAACVLACDLRGVDRRADVEVAVIGGFEGSGGVGGRRETEETRGEECDSYGHGRGLLLLR